jgi:hypothetical protein
VALPAALQEQAAKVKFKDAPTPDNEPQDDIHFLSYIEFLKRSFICKSYFLPPSIILMFILFVINSTPFVTGHNKCLDPS